MWLKLRMQFFADFNKKSLRTIVERFVCLDFKTETFITKKEKDAD